MGDASYWLPAAIGLAVSMGGISLLLLLTQDRTRTNVAIATVYLAVALAGPTTLLLVDSVDRSDPGWPARLQGLFEVVGLAGSLVYLDGLRVTGQVTPRVDRLTRAVVGCAIVLTLWHAVAVLAFPAQRLNDYQLSLFDAGDRGTPGFWMFAVFWIVVGVVFIVGWLVLASQRLDPAEADRAAAAAAGSTFLVLGTALPAALSLACLLAAGLVVLWGQFQYAVAQARRGVFLGRFLSPQVTELVHARGIAAVMRPHQVELSVVACDLRDFTPYSDAVPSQAVVDLLGEYYEAVGGAVAEHGGTITSYAGDGVLVLVGAPVERSDHAAVALALAERLLEAVQPVLDRWSTRPHPLGLGVGVASGIVTVGTIESSTRAEYTAVGTAVNLAARLCSAARSDEVLVADHTARLAGRENLDRREPMPIKGLTGLQPVYALDRRDGQVARATETFSSESGSTTS